MERHNIADGVLENRWQQSHKHLKMKMKEMEGTNEKNQQVSYIANRRNGKFTEEDFCKTDKTL